MPQFRLAQHFASLLCLALPALVGAATSQLIAEYDFQDAFGQPDAQGWNPQFLGFNPDSYFHVDDFTGADQIASPLSGSRSMWCGLPAEDPRTCHWDTPPGYGALWNQDLISTEFTVQGDVTLDFLMTAASEPGYDFAFVQYEDNNGDWQPLDTYNINCDPVVCPTIGQSYVVPAAQHDGTIRFRFKFTSDGAGDAETIQLGISELLGFIVDDIQVSDQNGVVDFQDFESESIGATATNDGKWIGQPSIDGYNAGILLMGSDVLQESPTTNDTPLWAFFNDSTRDYGCAGHPEQLVVDETSSIAHSPFIDITHDIDGYALPGEADSLLIEFDVYRDFAGPDQKTYYWIVDDYSDDCLLRRFSTYGGGRGDGPDWYRHQVFYVPEPGTTRILLKLGTRNSNVDPANCGSVAPLIDNVSVTRFGQAPTGSDGAIGRRLMLKPSRPNPFNPSTTLEFELPVDASVCTLRIYDVAGRLVRSLYRGALPAGPRSLQWDGRDEADNLVASGVYVAELVADELRATRRMVLLK